MKIFKAISLGALLALPLGVACGSSKSVNADGGGGRDGSAAGGHGGTGGTGAGGTSGTDGGAGAGGTIGTDGGAGAGGAIGTDGGDGPVGLLEFTDFVNDLIVNKTAPNTRPETIDDKMFKDSMNPAAFDLLFK